MSPGAVIPFPAHQAYLVCAGFLLMALLFSLEAVLAFRVKAYLPVLAFDLAFLAYCGFGAWSGFAGREGVVPILPLVLRELAAGALLVVLPWLLRHFIEGPPGLARFHRGLSVLGALALGALSIVALLGAPGLFLGPDAPGPLLGGLRFLLALVLGWTLIILLADAFVWKSLGAGFGLAPLLLALGAALLSMALPLAGRGAGSLVPPESALPAFALVAAWGFVLLFLRQARGLRDAALALERGRARLAELLDRDEATGLPNRRAFARDLGEELALPGDEGRAGGRGSVVLLVLEPAPGADEAAIPGAAKALAAAVPPGARPFRTGEAAFAVLLPEGSGEAEALAAAPGLRDALGGESCAILLLPGDGASPAEALAHAFDALAASRASGGTPLRWSAATPRGTGLPAGTLASLRSAIRDGDFSLEYQPVVDWTGAVVSAEALVRRKGGGEGPGSFIPLLESAGLMEEMGDLILRLLAEDLGEELADGRVPSVSLNLSHRQILDNSSFRSLSRILRNGTLPASRLRFEVAEPVFLDRRSKCLGRLAELRRHGSKVAVDDFGTGYSDLARFQGLPVDILKLDRCFLPLVPGARAAEILVGAVADLGRSCGLVLAAEGVESAAQRGFLEKAGFREFQGYLFSRPLPKAALLRFVDRGGSRGAAGSPSG